MSLAVLDRPICDAVPSWPVRFRAIGMSRCQVGPPPHAPQGPGCLSIFSVPTRVDLSAASTLSSSLSSLLSSLSLLKHRCRWVPPLLSLSSGPPPPLPFPPLDVVDASVVAPSSPSTLSPSVAVLPFFSVIWLTFYFRFHSCCCFHSLLPDLMNARCFFWISFFCTFFTYALDTARFFV
jgi:hypothetical protein